MTLVKKETISDMSGEEVKAPEIKKRVAEGNWMAQKDKLKKMFPTLTYADLGFVEGKRDEMLERVQSILGKSREELLAIIAAL